MQIAGKFIEKSSCEYGVGRKNINQKKHKMKDYRS